MNEFRKQLHTAYKEKLSNILLSYSVDLFENIAEFTENPELFCHIWVNRNCLPMGDCSREEAIKEIDAWQENDVR